MNQKRTFHYYRPGNLSGLELTLNDQPDDKRLVLHALYYAPVHRCKRMDILEDVVPLRDVSVTLTGTGRSVRAARLAPQGAEIPVERTENGVRLVIPEIRGHQMVALEYE